MKQIIGNRLIAKVNNITILAAKFIMLHKKELICKRD